MKPLTFVLQLEIASYASTFNLLTVYSKLSTKWRETLLTFPFTSNQKHIHINANREIRQSHCLDYYFKFAKICTIKVKDDIETNSLCMLIGYIQASIILP